MDGQDGRGHHGDERRRGERRDGAERDQKAAGELGRARRPGVLLARTQAELFEEPRSAFDSVSAECAEQLLRAWAANPRPTTRRRTRNAISTMKPPKLRWKQLPWKRLLRRSPGQGRIRRLSRLGVRMEHQNGTVEETLGRIAEKVTASTCGEAVAQPAAR
jgi:hypothetical protein